MRLPHHALSIASALAALLLGTASHAAPGIAQTSGVFADAATIKIVGSGFGTKSVAAPLVWDNFERGTVGTLIGTSKAIIGAWDSGAGYDAWKYSSTLVRNGSKAAVATATPTRYNISLSKNGSFPVIYMDWWVLARYKDNPSRNWKPWRVYGANDKMSANYVWMCPQDGYGLSVIAEDGSDKFDWKGVPAANATWFHFQVFLKASSPNKADGVVRQYVNGVLTNNLTGVKTRAGTSQWNQIRIGHYWGSEASSCKANSGADIYIDNAYVDTSWAHIEIGNAQTYAASTVREIQIPSAWSDKAISFTVNQGSFKGGTKAYLYVFDANGNPNATGYPITMGGSGGTTASSGSATDTAPPAAPTGLRVITP